MTKPTPPFTEGPDSALIDLTREQAVEVMEAQAVCFGEGIGPEQKELLDIIFNFWPGLRERYKWIK